MKFAYQFSLFLFCALLVMIASNIFALRHYSEQYFAEYVSVVKKDTPEINLEMVGSVIAGKGLDESTLAEYKATINDLGNISSSLERFSKDPKAYASIPVTQTGKTALSPMELLIGGTESLFSKVLSFRSFGTDTPE